MKEEPEIIKLKKEIYHLKEQNAEMAQELEEKTKYIGELETEYSKMKNEHLLITRTKLTQQQEIIRLNVEKALEDEKARMEFLEKTNDELQRKVAVSHLI